MRGLHHGWGEGETFYFSVVTVKVLRARQPLNWIVCVRAPSEFMTNNCWRRRYPPPAATVIARADALNMPSVWCRCARVFAYVLSKHKYNYMFTSRSLAVLMCVCVCVCTGTRTPRSHEYKDDGTLLGKSAAYTKCLQNRPSP